MSSAVRLHLRAPPHLPFIQGFPGISASADAPNRPPPGIHGTVEVRIGPVPIQARWVRVEIRQHETLPSGFPNHAPEAWEHVHPGVDPHPWQVLWSTPQGKEWDTLDQPDFKFFIPLPENIPPSIEMSKGTGIRYELVAALCHKQKGGVFKKDSVTYVKTSEQIMIVKHELHSAWPIYNVPLTRTINGSGQQAGLLTVQRQNTAFGPSDRILLTASLRSSRPKPFKLKGFECHLYEVITALPAPSGSNSTKSRKSKAHQPVTKAREVAVQRFPVDERVDPGQEKSARMELIAPSICLCSVYSARVMRVEYELEVRAICDGNMEVKMSGLSYTVGPFARPHAQQAVSDIGYVGSLCPDDSKIRSPPVSRTTSPQSQHSPNLVQGFASSEDWRRSSATSTSLRAMSAEFNDERHENGDSALNRRPMAFPSPQPNDGSVKLERANTAWTYATTTDTSQRTADSPLSAITPEQSSQGEARPGDMKRYSSATAATFGKWDGNLQAAMNSDGAPLPSSSPSTPTPSRPSSAFPAGQSTPSSPDREATSTPLVERALSPTPTLPIIKTPSSAWPASEQEKIRLYADARERAAAAQSATGASLDTIGLAPPEYAPRRPVKDSTEYRAPSRPVSVYTIASVADTVTETAAGPSAVPTDEPAPAKLRYLSASEEKEQQRKRFEDAQRRVVSAGSTREGGSVATSSAVPVASSSAALNGDMVNGNVPLEDPVPYDALFPSASGPSTAGPSTSISGPSTSGSSPSTSQPIMPSSAPNGPPSTAVNEKEQMRRYHEAQDRVARARQSSGGEPTVESPPPTSNPAPPPRSPTNTTLQPLSEKEQMKRYYEAQDRVSGTGRPPGSAPGPSAGPVPSTSIPAPPPRSPTINVPQPVSEKEQMRRYHEAQDRVAGARQASGSAGITSADPASSTSIPTAPPRSPTINAPQPVSEKEQMRRYHEAQDRVAGARQSSGSDGSTSADPAPSAFVPTAPSGTLANNVPQSLSEKAQMKRYYEAQDRVSRQGTVSTPVQEEDKPNPTPPESSRPIALPISRTQSSPPPAQQYFSAEQEKDLMRMRFEQAQSAVRRSSASAARQAEAPPFTPSVTGVASEGGSIRRVNGSASGGASSGLGNAASTANAGEPSASPSPSKPTSPPDSTLVRDPTVKLGKARAAAMSPEPIGPPPPLPTKPPREYIRLLSPVEERAAPIWATPSASLGGVLQTAGIGQGD